MCMFSCISEGTWMHMYAHEAGAGQLRASHQSFLADRWNVRNRADATQQLQLKVSSYLQWQTPFNAKTRWWRHTIATSDPEQPCMGKLVLAPDSWSSHLPLFLPASNLALTTCEGGGNRIHAKVEGAKHASWQEQQGIHKRLLSCVVHYPWDTCLWWEQHSTRSTKTLKDD